VAHLYNLRKSQRYRERRLNYTKTRPTTVATRQALCRAATKRRERFWPCRPGRESRGALSCRQLHAVEARQA